MKKCKGQSVDSLVLFQISCKGLCVTNFSSQNIQPAIVDEELAVAENTVILLELSKQAGLCDAH